MRTRQFKFRSRVKGLSLLELLIAMTLGLATVGAVVYVYSNTTRTYRTQDALARLQEGARFAFETISNDLRMVGATGCGKASSYNAINGPTNWERNLLARPLFATAKTGAAGVNQYSDALSIVRADVSSEYRVSAHNTASSLITLTAAHDLTLGQYLVATDCTHTAVFQATNNASPTVAHIAGSGTPGNSSANLGPAGAVYAFPAGSRLYRLSSARYYVANNAAGVPSLYRQRPLGATNVVTAEELVEGVEDMRVTFGVDTTPTVDGLIDPAAADPYLSIAKIDDGSIPALGATVDDHWSRVVSVRISFLMQTPENNIATDPQTYAYNGASSVLATDRRLRKVFTHVVRLRNRT